MGSDQGLDDVVMPSAGAGRRFIEELITTAEADPSIIDRPGTTLAPTQARAGSNVCVRYVVGNHVLLWHDPALTSALEPLASSTVSLGDDEWAQAIAERGWEAVGGSLMKILPVPIDVFPTLADGLLLHRFDWNLPEDLALVQALIDVSSEEDLEEAEVEIDDLDDLAIGILDAEGVVVAYTSSREFDYAQNFGDIGIIVRADARGRGLGAAAVLAMVKTLQRAGIDPLYRCDVVNSGSDRLSANLGFAVQTRLTAALAS